MGELEVGPALVQFGVAGLIGWMWLSERRWAQAREKQLSEAHERLMQERASQHALVEIVKDNTRAMAALEHGQRALVELVAELRRVRTPPAPGVERDAAGDGRR